MAHPGSTGTADRVMRGRRARMSLAALVVGDAVLAGVALGFTAGRGPDHPSRRETVVVTTAPSPLASVDGKGAMSADVVAATNPTPSPSTTTTTGAPAPAPSSTTSAPTTTSLPAEVAETPSTTAPTGTTAPTTTTLAPEPTAPTAAPRGDGVSG
jgi:hypothetical protein